VNYAPEIVPSVQSSGNLRGAGKFLFDLWSCVRSKKDSDVIGNTALVIGYEEVGVEEFVYIVIPNSVISDEVEIIKVDRDHLESKFQECKRPNTGLLKKPKKGDTVMCIAKGRYAGVQGGAVNEVLGMPEGRVKIHEDHHATYEDTYFVVCCTSDIVSVDGCGLVIKDSSGSIKSVNFPSMSTTTSLSSEFTKSLRNSLIDEEEIKKRVVVEADKLLKRKTVEESEIKKREVFNLETIKRTK
jgi:hypothetical protein